MLGLTVKLRLTLTATMTSNITVTAAAAAAAAAASCAQVWKLCPHAHHPSPHFQAAMVHNETVSSWKERTGRFVAGYLDAWLLWRVPDRVTSCTVPAQLNISDILAVPWDAHSPGSASSACQQLQSSRRLQAASSKALWHTKQLPGGQAQSAVKYCALEAAEPLLVQPGSRTASIAGRLFPMAMNAET
jgi:hypothetical protein